MLRATRDGENRVRFLGHNPLPYKVGAFAIAGILAGIGGALFTLHAGVVSPALVGVVPSIEMVVWVALGGRNMLWGAIAGTLLVNFAKDQISSALPSLWLYGLGALFILAVSFLPAGIAGLFKPGIAEERVMRRILSRRRAGDRRMNAIPAPLLMMENVTVDFDGFKALNDVIAHAAPRHLAHPHRPQRRRQIDALRHHHRPRPRHLRQDHLQGPGDHHTRRAGDRAPRHLPQIPDPRRAADPDRDAKICWWRARKNRSLVASLHRIQRPPTKWPAPRKSWRKSA